ncbi:hypothetical protein BH10PSE19_BH10PSE19_01940 [soil metagenome]
MQIEPKDMQAATQAKLISSEQAQLLWSFWQQQQEDVPHFKLAHVMYYFGGLLAISAVSLFVTQAWDQLRGLPLFILSSLLFLLGLLLTHHFLRKKLAIPAGIMATFSLVIVPLAVYNIQLWLGLLPSQPYHYADFHYWVNWYWVPMELITLLAGAILLYCYGFPFLLFPVSIALWYLSMDLFSLLFALNDFSYRSEFSLYFGLAVIFAALYMDFKYSDQRTDYAFWLYIVGVMLFWSGLSLQYSGNELAKFIYCLINVGMILISVLLNRRVFAVFGAIGVLGYLGHLAFTLFAQSLGFPIALVFLGILIIFAATRWSQAEHKLIEYLAPYLSQKMLDKMRGKVSTTN